MDRQSTGASPFANSHSSVRADVDSNRSSDERAGHEAMPTASGGPWRPAYVPIICLVKATRPAVLALDGYQLPSSGTARVLVTGELRWRSTATPTAAGDLQNEISWGRSSCQQVAGLSGD